MLIMDIANILLTLQTVCPWRKFVRSSEKGVYMELAHRLLLGWESSLANHQGEGGYWRQEHVVSKVGQFITYYQEVSALQF